MWTLLDRSISANVPASCFTTWEATLSLTTDDGDGDEANGSMLSKHLLNHSPVELPREQNDSHVLVL